MSLGKVLVALAGVGAIRYCTLKVTDALKWRAYYQSEKDTAVPPGYFRSEKWFDGSEIDVKPVSKTPSSEASEEALKANIKKTIDNTFDAVKREIDPLEDRKTAYMDDNMTKSDKNKPTGDFDGDDAVDPISPEVVEEVKDDDGNS